MIVLEAESSHTVRGFHAMLAVCRTEVERDIVLPVAEELARHAGAQLELARLAACEQRADVVVMSAAHARRAARRLLDASTAVVVVPPRPESATRLVRIGIGYDGGGPADAALLTACALVAARPGQVSHVDVVHVDDSASGVAARRTSSALVAQPLSNGGSGRSARRSRPPSEPCGRSEIRPASWRSSPPSLIYSWWGRADARRCDARSREVSPPSSSRRRAARCWSYRPLGLASRS
jgi:hypothetical protein